MTMQQPSVDGIRLPDEFIVYLEIQGKTDQILDSPNSLALIVKEFQEWQRGKR